MPSPQVDNSKNKFKRILIVDDEKPILSSLNRLFKHQKFIVYSAQSAQEGLEMLRKYPVDVIVSDLRMPMVSGYEFLKDTINIAPGALRIILTGLPEEKLEDRKGDNQNIVDLYIEKPWSNSEIVNLINQSLVKMEYQHTCIESKGDRVNTSNSEKCLFNENGPSTEYT